MTVYILVEENPYGDTLLAVYAVRALAERHKKKLEEDVTPPEVEYKIFTMRVRGSAR